MALQERLDPLRAMSKTRIPPEAQAVMPRSIADLRTSGIMSRVARTGQRAPAFTLPYTSGREVSLAELVARSPVVLSFYRGR